MFSRTEFHPQITAILFFTMLLFGLFLNRTSTVTSFSTLLFICFPALVITYLPLTAFFIFSLGGIYILQKVSGKSIIQLYFFAFCILIFFVWEIYWATRFFNNFVVYIREFLIGLSDPLNRLLPVFNIAQNKLGESVPLWASLTRFFWMASIFLLGVILGVRNLFLFRKVSTVETMLTGGLWGVIAFSLICILTFSGSTQSQRLLTYGPFFTVPIIMMFLLNPNSVASKRSINKLVLKRWTAFKRYAVIYIFMAFILLSLPTFLVNRSDIGTKSIYKYELSTGDFVQNLYNNNKALRFFTDVQTVYYYAFYIPDGRLNNPPQPWEIANEEEEWAMFNNMLSKFESFKQMSVFVLTERFDQVYRTIAEVKPTDTEWQEFIGKLSTNVVIYNNGHTSMYLNQPGN
ncbi:MAG: hypothetical protein A2Z74_03170 [Chloroflexi bacterium RBG_13_46_9]|nr:MAG: hypothetical protein A2Z74_03170 [Chloroflexi bacterium RBG_13_46_9]